MPVKKKNVFPKYSRTFVTLGNTIIVNAECEEFRPRTYSGVRPWWSHPPAPRRFFIVNKSHLRNYITFILLHIIRGYPRQKNNKKRVELGTMNITIKLLTIKLCKI